MDPGLRQAWTGIVTADDYEQHMAAIGQAQAAAELTSHILRWASLPLASAITIAGAGTGQMFQYLDAAIFRPHRLTCADLNASFLRRLGDRLATSGLHAEIVEADFEQSRLMSGMNLLLATLLFEHIDWRRGVETVAHLRPAIFAVTLQENRPGMTSAIAPGRANPPSITQVSEAAHPALVPRAELIEALAAHDYSCREFSSRAVADSKQLLALLFAAGTR